jgi:hypothetical protein
MTSGRKENTGDCFLAYSQILPIILLARLGVTQGRPGRGLEEKHPIAAVFTVVPAGSSQTCLTGAAMQWPDDAEERSELADMDADAPPEQTYARWRYILLLIAAGCALVSLGMDLVPRSFISSDFDAPPWLVAAWFAPPISALVSFVGAFLCALGCGRGRSLLRHVSVVLCDATVMALMYLYRPWMLFDTEPPRIAYGFMWSPPPPRMEMLDGMAFAVGRLVLQYMLVILVSSILTLLLTREPPVKTG